MNSDYRTANTFIFDLDGTLLNEHHELSALTIQTLHSLRARKANVVIATGRHIGDIRCYLTQLGGGIAAITSNGANIHDADGNLIYSQGLPLSVNQALLSLGEQFPVYTNLYSDTEWLINRDCEAVLAAHARSQFFYRVLDRQAMLNTPALKIYFYGEPKQLLALQAQIPAEISAALNVTFSDESHLEFMQKNISKGNALLILLERLGLSPSETMAFGDSMNDVELLRTVAHPIVMQNAVPALNALFPAAARAPANYKDGVAQFLLQNVIG